MARRSAHSPEELRQLILSAARGIIETKGLLGLSAREIAGAIGYSPGTLYNIFENLDDVLSTLQTQMLGQMLEVMIAVPKGATPNETITNLARAYLNFAIENKLMWNLLFTHQVPATAQLRANINRLGEIVAAPFAELQPRATKPQNDLAARSLWAGVHGITAIAVTEKGPTLNPATAQVFVDQLVSTYMRGLSK